MNRFKRLLLATTAVVSVSSAHARAEEFRLDQLFVVGDSLSDAGTYSQVVVAGSGGALPSDIQYRFTNNAPDGSSLNYSQVLANELGIGPVLPNVLNGVVAPGGTRVAGSIETGGTNFAQGGARVAVGTDGLDGITRLPVTIQVDRLLEQNPQFGPTDLIIMWAGANDVEAIAEAGDADAGLQVVTAANQMAVQVQRVLDAGATNVVVVTVPDIANLTPLGASITDPADKAGLEALTAAYNNALVAGVGGKVTVVNSSAILGDILADPVRYGFSATDPFGTLACPGGTPGCIIGLNGTDNGEIFADLRHPSAAVNRVFAQMSHATLVAVGQVGVMPVATISALRQQSIGLESRLNLGAFFIGDKVTGERKRRPAGNIEVYGGAEAGFYESDAQQVVPGFDASTQVVKAAADVMITPNIMVGVGGSVDHGQVEFANDRGGFDSRLFVGALFGVAQIVPGVYVNGILGGGLIDVYEIDRNFGIRTNNGVTTESYEGDTEGTYFVARTNVGAVLPVGNGFFVNPSVGIAYETVNLDGYSESAIGGSAPGLAGSYGDLEYEGYRGTLALAGFYRPPSDPTWTLGLRASWEHDFNDDDIVVRHANGGSPLAPSIAPRPDDSYGLLSANVAKELSHSSVLNIQGSTNIAQDGVTGYTISAVLKYTF